jgi:hypothetical protein
MKFVKQNWYGLDHKAVARMYEGNPVFLNDFCVKGEYAPSAVYYVAKPNKRKGHCTYLLLSGSGVNMFVRGMSPREMNKYRHQDAMHCLSCDEVIYSVNRHDYRTCSCGKVSIDGGKDYTKASFKKGAKWTWVNIDLITNKISSKI